MLSACGGDGDPEPAPEPSGSPTTDGPADDAVEPATGPAVTGRQFRVHLPEGYRVGEHVAYGWIAHDPRRSGDAVSVAATPAFSFVQLDRAAQVTMRSLGDDPPVTREADVELDGFPAFRLTATDRYTVREMVGTTRNGQIVSVDFQFDRTTPPARRAAITEAVLASWEWR